MGEYLACGRLGPHKWGGRKSQKQKTTNRHQMCNNLTRSVLGPWGGLLRSPGEASWGKRNPRFSRFFRSGAKGAHLFSRLFHVAQADL